MGWGRDLYDLVRIPIKRPCKGYYLRWYYNGWHYWFFLPGSYSVLTEGEAYRTIGTRSIQLSSGQIDRGQAQAIRTIMNTREVYLLTIAGWMNIRLIPGSLIVYDNRQNGVEIEITAIIGSKEISYDTGCTPIPNIPIVPYSTAYCELTIGSQIWMCQNFDSNYPGSKVYNNDEANRVIYGGLYTYNQIMNPGFCPAGWHVPTYAEWQTLVNYVGTLADAGGILKELGTDRWTAPNTGATDAHGFAMRPTGYAQTGNNYFALGILSGLWAADEYDVTRGYVARVFNNSAALDFYNSVKVYYFGVRLIKDTEYTYNDWFLPSINELQEIYNEVYLYGLIPIGYQTEMFSSSEVNATNVYVLLFTLGGIQVSNSKFGGAGFNFTPCRKFISSISYTLRSLGLSGGYIFHIIDNGDGTNTYYELFPGGYYNNSGYGWITAAWQGTFLNVTDTSIGAGQKNTNDIIVNSAGAYSIAKLCKNITL